MISASCPHSVFFVDRVLWDTFTFLHAEFPFVPLEIIHGSDGAEGEMR